MNKFVCTKSHTGSKFSKNNFGAIMHLSDCSSAPILQFFDAVLDGATSNSQIPDRIFGQFFYQFEEGLRHQLCIDLDVVYTHC